MPAASRSKEHCANGLPSLPEQASAKLALNSCDMKRGYEGDDWPETSAIGRVYLRDGMVVCVYQRLSHHDRVIHKLQRPGCAVERSNRRTVRGRRRHRSQWRHGRVLGATACAACGGCHHGKTHQKTVCHVTTVPAPASPTDIADSSMVAWSAARYPRRGCGMSRCPQHLRPERSTLTPA